MSFERGEKVLNVDKKALLMINLQSPNTNIVTCLMLL